MFRKFIGVAVLAASALAASGPAFASSFQFQNAGDSVTVLYSWAYTDSNNVTPVQLSAQVVYTLNSFVDNNTATFGIEVQNTTPAAQAGTNRITAFGVDVVTPSLTGAGSNSSVFGNAVLNSNMPSGIGRVDLCATSGPSNCSGGGGGGLSEGQIDTFMLTLDFSANVPPITFQNFVIRYQSVGVNSAGSIAFTGCVSGDPNCDPRQVPAPGSLALVGAALLGLYAVRRRRPV
ncbi:MAG: cistern family PEP-CTERM protein [Rubrivivax sp.]|nr:cistern family PEP-CTERM protein [Rubrivivax sp.]